MWYGAHCTARATAKHVVIDVFVYIFCRASVTESSLAGEPLFLGFLAFPRPPSLAKGEADVEAV